MSRRDEPREVSVGDRLYRVCGTASWRRPEDTYQLAERVVVEVRSPLSDRVRVDQPFPGGPAYRSPGEPLPEHIRAARAAPPNAHQSAGKATRRQEP